MGSDQEIHVLLMQNVIGHQARLMDSSELINPVIGAAVGFYSGQEKPVEKVSNNKLKPRFRFSSAPASEPEGDFGIQRVRKTPDRIEDYANRTGYNPLFIDGKTRIELPVLSDALKCDVATFAWNGQETHELKYMHFSTAVSKSRRMPIFSACNIEGSATKTVARTNVWKLDPRIPAEYQMLHEVYGNQRDGYFSRGHMTRRQDPDWGPKTLLPLPMRIRFMPPMPRRRCNASTAAYGAVSKTIFWPIPNTTTCGYASLLDQSFRRTTHLYTASKSRRGSGKSSLSCTMKRARSQRLDISDRKPPRLPSLSQKQRRDL